MVNNLKQVVDAALYKNMYTFFYQMLHYTVRVSFCWTHPRPWWELYSGLAPTCARYIVDLVQPSPDPSNRCNGCSGQSRQSTGLH